MGLVDDHADAVALRDGNERRQVGHVAVHRINALDDGDPALSLVLGQGGVERVRVVVSEELGPGAGRLGALEPADVAALVEDRDVAPGISTSLNRHGYRIGEELVAVTFKVTFAPGSTN